MSNVVAVRYSGNEYWVSKSYDESQVIDFVGDIHPEVAGGNAYANFTDGVWIVGIQAGRKA